jgi:hypothetical protein
MLAMNVVVSEEDETGWLRAHVELSRLAKERAMADAEEGRWLLAALRSAAHVHLGFGSFGRQAKSRSRSALLQSETDIFVSAEAGSPSPDSSLCPPNSRRCFTPRSPQPAGQARRWHDSGGELPWPFGLASSRRSQRRSTAAPHQSWEWYF